MSSIKLLEGDSFDRNQNRSNLHMQQTEQWDD
jgi:hypothetical protein